MPNIRVMPFGLGPIGASVVKQLASRPGFKLVGAVDVDPAKVGRDLGDVAGLPKRLGIRISDNPAKALKAARPDVVVLCTSSSLKKVMPQIEAILKSQTAVSAIGSASIAKPGLTPVPSTPTLALIAQL